MIRFRWIPPDEVSVSWRGLAPFVEKMAEREPDTWPAHEQKRAAEAGDIDLWLVWSEEDNKALGILATRLALKASGARWMTVPFAAGEQHERWAVEAEEHATELARLNHCTAVESYARDGWSRAVPGYRRTGSIYRKEL